MAKTPLGRLDPRAFGTLELPRLDQAILDGFRALGDLTGTTSDALDECRLAGVGPGSSLRPTDARAAR
jgi:4-hydroxy-4-methyl-2-oxoglutarate aldolase